MTDNLTPDPLLLPQTAKAAMHELLRNGWLEAAQKPESYHQLVMWLDAINQALDPLDLCACLDDIRGLAWLAVPADWHNSEDEWAHPLVRRQRLTLEQSLLLAILRQSYIDIEQTHGIGSEQASVDIDELQAQLSLYLGNSGSELKDDKRLRILLEALRKHGVVGEINDSGQVHIRPLIAHVANPETLTRMLKQYRTLANQTKPAKENDNN